MQYIRNEEIQKIEKEASELYAQFDELQDEWNTYDMYVALRLETEIREKITDKCNEMADWYKNNATEIDKEDYMYLIGK